MQLLKGLESPLIVLGNRQEVSNLLQVCSESRQEALRFYRVQVPCFYKQPGRLPRKGIFYFHPELDILDIQGASLFPKLSQILWEHDPERVGLINIGLAQSHHKGYFDSLFKIRGSRQERRVREALTRLRLGIFGYDGKVGRGIPISDPGPRGTTDIYLENQMQRSRPLVASISKFERLARDSRPIETELRRIFMDYGDPRDQIYRWFRLLEWWQVEHEDHAVDYHFMIAFDNREVDNRGEAFLSLQEEKRQWAAWQRHCESKGVPCSDDEQVLPFAFGFWLFPIDAFGPIPEANTQIRTVGISRRRDEPQVWKLLKAWKLSGHPPELCLQCLPDAPGNDPNMPEGLESESLSLLLLSIRNRSDSILRQHFGYNSTVERFE